MNCELNKQREKTGVLRKAFEIRELTILVIIVLLSITLTIASKNFFTGMNLMIVINGFAVNMIFTVGMTISLIACNIDFSVGSTLGVCGFATAIALHSGMPIVVSIIIGIVTGAILGAINGVLIVRLKVLPIVVTLGTWYAYKGIGLMMIGNQSMAQFPDAFNSISQQTNLFGIPFNVLVMVIVVIIGTFVLKYVNFFHQAFFIGCNPESARLAGIKVDRFVVITYTITGMLCGLAGILAISRLGSAPASLGQGLEFNGIVGMLIGGVSFNGGEGSILGAFLGMLLMSIICNGLAILGINSYAQLIITGVILIGSVSIDEANRRRKEGIN